MDISSDELLRRTNTLKQFEDYFENITNTLNNFVEQIGWIPDKLPNNVIIQYFFEYQLTKLYLEF